MRNAAAAVLGGLLLLAAIAIQAARPLWDSVAPWLPPAAAAMTWVCLLSGGFLIASTRNRRDHDSS